MNKFMMMLEIILHLGVIVFIRLFWLIGIAGALQTVVIVLICCSCVRKKIILWEIRLIYFVLF